MRKNSVLIINTNGMGQDGITNVILNYISKMERDGLDFHFVASEDSSDTIREKLKQYGTVHVIPSKQQDIGGYIRGLNDILKLGIDIIHIHGSSGLMAIETILARFHKVKRIMVHGHSTGSNHPVLNRMLRPVMCLTATDLIACSDVSGKWLYRTRKHTVLNNAIDLNRFAYSAKIREEVRKELQVENSFLIGHIGGFIEPKNHEYLIEIFAEFCKKNKNTKLLLVGEGLKYDEIIRKVEILGLSEYVIFTGRRMDAYRLYHAMDAFVMPSRWEGLPLVLLEAQASGLPILASDRITRDVDCTDSIRFLSIEESPSVWANQLVRLASVSTERCTGIEKLRQHGFDIELEAKKLKQIYMQD